MFKVLRGAAILFYVVALIAGLFMLYGLAMVFIEVGQGAMVEPSSLLITIALTIVPAAVGYVLDRLSIIGTTQAG